MNEKQAFIINLRMKTAAIKQLLRDSGEAGLIPEQIDSLLDTLQIYKNIIDDLNNQPEE